MESERIASRLQPVEKTFESQTLIPIERVPERFQRVFASYMYFNRIQSEVFPSVFETDDSILVSAPTGSGKTAVFELAIIKFLNDVNLDSHDSNFKIVYVAPMKAICEERLLDWHKKFAPLGLNAIMATGDSDNISFNNLLNHNLIITTPEKWDSLTRNWRTYLNFVKKVGLFMIDEVHLLNDESRGPTLEAIVSRMKTIQADIQNQLRFVAVSATIPNVEDVAEWIKTKSKSARHFSFSDETRPVKLTKVVLGYHFNPTSTYFKFDIMLSYKLQSIMLQYANRRPTLIFCSTRKSVEMTSKHLVQNLSIRLNDEQKQTLVQAANKLVEKPVKDILVYGVGMHHAGLLPESRNLIQELFRNSELPVLVTTSTLAMGVNLPAHLVIIKSTKQYFKGEYKDYSESSLLQMIGRAGRPQYDSTATAVILTTSADKVKFEKMVGGTQPVESSLHKSLTEHLNAEIVLRTITDIGVAMEWLASTFLYIRAKKNPRHYGFAYGLSPAQIDAKLLEVCQISINKLSKYGMIIIDYNVSIQPTKNGCLMAKYYIHFETMKLFLEVNGTECLRQILSLISRCHEFSDMCLRGNDKKALNLLNKCKNRETIRFPLCGKIKTLDMKINCMIQAIFGCLEIVESSLLSEVQKIMRIGERVSNCLAEFLEANRKCYSALHSALVLAKCFNSKLWENSPYVSRQLTGIGPVMSSSLVAAGKTTFQEILNTNPRMLETIMHRKYPQGDVIFSQIEKLPQYDLSLEELKVTTTTSRVKVIITLKNIDKLKDKMTLNRESFMNLLIGDEDNNIWLYEKYTHSCLLQNGEISKELIEDFTTETILSAHFFSENWVGIDSTATLYLFCSPPIQEAKKKPMNKNKPKLANESVKETLKEKVGNPQAKRFIDQYFEVVKTSGGKATDLAKQQVKTAFDKEVNKDPSKGSSKSPGKSEDEEIKLLMEEGDDNFDSFDSTDLRLIEDKLLDSSNNLTKELVEAEDVSDKVNIISNVIIQRPDKQFQRKFDDINVDISKPETGEYETNTLSQPKSETFINDRNTRLRSNPEPNSSLAKPDFKSNIQSDPMETKNAARFRSNAEVNSSLNKAIKASKMNAGPSNRIQFTDQVGYESVDSRSINEETPFELSVNDANPSYRIITNAPRVDINDYPSIHTIQSSSKIDSGFKSFESDANLSPNVPNADTNNYYKSDGSIECTSKHDSRSFKTYESISQPIYRFNQPDASNYEPNYLIQSISKPDSAFKSYDSVSNQRNIFHSNAPMTASRNCESNPTIQSASKRDSRLKSGESIADSWYVFNTNISKADFSVSESNCTIQSTSKLDSRLHSSGSITDSRYGFHSNERNANDKSYCATQSTSKFASGFKTSESIPESKYRFKPSDINNCESNHIIQSTSKLDFRLKTSESISDPRYRFHPNVPKPDTNNYETYASLQANSKHHTLLSKSEPNEGFTLNFPKAGTSGYGSYSKSAYKSAESNAECIPVTNTYQEKAKNLTFDIQARNFNEQKNSSRKMNTSLPGNKFKDNKKQNRAFHGATRAFDWEQSLYKESPKQSMKECFKLQPKKRLNHETVAEPDSTGNSYGIVEMLLPKRSKPNPMDSKKNIKWSSPLVTSPHIKYSPRYSACNLTRKPNDRPLVNRLMVNKDIVDFPVSDQQCGYATSTSDNANMSQLSDFLAHSTLKSFQKMADAAEDCSDEDLASYVQKSGRVKRESDFDDSTASRVSQEHELSFQNDTSKELFDKSLENVMNDCEQNAEDLCKSDDALETSDNEYLQNYTGQGRVQPYPQFNPVYDHMNYYDHRRNYPMQFGPGPSVGEPMARPVVRANPMLPPYYLPNPDYYGMHHPYAFYGQSYMDPRNWYQGQYFNPNDIPPR